MKVLFLLLIFFSFPVLGNDLEDSFSLSPNVIFPYKAEIHLHYLFRNFKRDSKQCPKGYVYVEGPGFTEEKVTDRGTLTNSPDVAIINQHSVCLRESIFNTEVKLGEAVFRTQVGTGTGNEATSFLVGKNIIMTNHHVVAPKDGELSNCRAVKVSLNNEPPKWVKCKKLLHCSKKDDYCFVEMDPFEKGKELGHLVTPLALDCKKFPAQSATLIGNSNAFGIQASRAKIDPPRSNGHFYHYIPMVGGASGSPVLGLDNKVKGINHSHTGKSDWVSLDGNAKNVGTSLFWVNNEVRSTQSTMALLAMVADDKMKKLLVEKVMDLQKIIDVLNTHSSCK